MGPETSVISQEYSVSEAVLNGPQQPRRRDSGSVDPMKEGGLFSQPMLSASPSPADSRGPPYGGPFALGATTTTSAPSSNANPYGLGGMLNVVRMNNVNLNVLALGTDLTSLGLNLNEREPLSSLFASPFLEEQPHKEELEFEVPACYCTNPSGPKISHFQRFTSETLFYVFYAIAGSTLQGLAAAELYNRGWLYHRGLRKWFIAVAPSSGVTKDTNDQKTTNALQEGDCLNDTAQALKSVTDWIYFEPNVWEKRNHQGTIDTSQFLNPEALRSLLEAPPEQRLFGGNGGASAVSVTEGSPGDEGTPSWPKDEPPSVVH